MRRGLRDDWDSVERLRAPRDASRISRGSGSPHFDWGPLRFIPRIEEEHSRVHFPELYDLRGLAAPVGRSLADESYARCSGCGLVISGPAHVCGRAADVERTAYERHSRYDWALRRRVWWWGREGRREGS